MVHSLSASGVLGLVPWPLPKAETVSISCYPYVFLALTHGQGLLAEVRASLVDLIPGLLVNFVP
jgi:hypothetical protein